MKMLVASLFALAVAANAQTTNQNQIRHVETSLNHLTVLEFGEPVTTLAVADPDSFQIEQRDDKVLVKPLKEGVATNLFVWTATRQLTYELDPAGQLASMDVLVKTDPPPGTSKKPVDSTGASDAEEKRLATAVLTQTLLDAQTIVCEVSRPVKDSISVELEQVYRAKGRLYIRYSVVNHTQTPFRLTPPNAYLSSPSREPLSLVSLQNHQLAPRTFAAFEAKPTMSLAVTQAESVVRDLAPGQNTTGVVSVSVSTSGSPQLYELHFGSDPHQPIVVAVVL